MARIYDARSECIFENKRILFDTNVWISIYGNDPSRERAAYSDFYGSALSKGNKIVTCVNVISELFNRMCKIEYEILFGRGEYHLLKSRRQSNADYIERVESVRDTCLSILEECDLIGEAFGSGGLESQLNEAAKGFLDLTDAALVANCLSNALIFVSHDSDFAHVDFDLVTANKRVLSSAQGDTSRPLRRPCQSRPFLCLAIVREPRSESRLASLYVDAPPPPERPFPPQFRSLPAFRAPGHALLDMGANPRLMSDEQQGRYAWSIG